ncbi:MAG: S-layer homology domain-containing protein [Clostridia bacterium]|nr:S-layer homology domain-containing protein [Clostridia bacterium]
MKKVIALMLSLLLIMPAALAATNSSNQMSEVLLKVKEKIEIPPELTEFESNISDYKGKITYNFDWHDEKYEKSINVSSDEKGRIINYNNHTLKLSDKRLTGISKKEIISFADAFLKKILPDMYTDASDTLALDEKSCRAGGSLRYYFTYNRCKNIVPVNNNAVNVCVAIDENGQLNIRSMSANIDYEASFVQKSGEVDALTEKYKEAFPMELVYKNEYNPDWKAKGEPRMLPVLIYRNKDNAAGYISVESGETVEEDKENNLFRDESAEDSVMGSMNKNEAFTEKELAEITAVGNLLSREEIENKVKALPYVVFPKNLSLESSHLSKNDEDKYLYSFHYSNKDDENYNYMSITADAKDGKLINYYCSTEYRGKGKVSLTEKEKASAQKKTEEFLKVAAGEDFENTKFLESSENNGYINSYYYRIVNNVKHADNGISVGFDTENSVVVSFSLNFTGGEFKDPTQAIGEEAAYEKLLSYTPIVRRFVKSGGSYKECVTLEKFGVTLDAITGEIKNKNDDSNIGFSYDDIKGHWVEKAATALAEIQIGFEEASLKPDSHVTQEDFLRLTASGIYGNYYHTYSQDDLYESLIREKIISEDEKAPSSTIKREDAFVFIIRMINLEKVAKLEDIYKVEFADSNLLSKDKIGYCAILSGFGVITGDGGYLRPTDNLSRGEAIAMLYKYLLSI